MLSKILKKQFCSQNDVKIQIMKGSLLKMNKYGWNDKAIVSACQDLELSSVSSKILRNGVYDVINYAMDDWNRQLENEFLKTKDFQDLKTHVKIQKSIQKRLTYQIPYINRWNEAMLVGAHPNNVQQTISNLWKMADDIWFYAGDKSTDYNHYTKRMILLKVYAETELFMLTDRSENFEETWKFLERRLKDVHETGQIISSVKNISNATINGVSSLFSILKWSSSNSMEEKQ